MADKHEDGYSLFELLLSLPIELMLSISMALIALQFCGSYENILGNRELIQQVNHAGEGIAKDIRYSDEIIVQEKKLILRRHDLLGGPLMVEYKVIRGNEICSLYKNDQPFVGWSEEVLFRMQRCEFTAIDPHSVKVHIVAKNVKSGKIYSFERICYSYACSEKYVNRV